MKEKYLTPSAETVLFDINNVAMEIALISLENNGEDNLINNIGNGLIDEDWLNCQNLLRI